ncbi:MAG: hypothetical protein ACT4O9_13115 [Blastocatellia bacterium]
MAFASVLLFTGKTIAQQGVPMDSSGMVQKPMTVAERNNLYCAGYVQNSPISTTNRIVGGSDEADQFIYSENEVVYVNAGSSKGVNVGDLMSVVRPRGQVKTRWTKKGSLGFYVQEVGVVEVIRVKAEVSVARIKTSCDNFLLGDLVQPAQQRTSPMHKQRPALDLYSDPNGKAMGRLFMGRDNQEMLTRDQIVYVDLGAEDNVSVGDYLTVFRPLGKGNILKGPPESVSARQEGYQSLTYKGGKFSNQAARKSGDQARGRVVTTGRAKDGRGDLRKVVGELVILNVKERTATAVIVRTAQEIHTGDWVEVQ